MDSSDGRRVELQFDDTSMPPTVFANHVEVVGVEGYTTVTFYSVVFPRAAHMQADPVVLKARAVAQVTLPGDKWQQLMENIRRVDEAAAEALEESDCSGDP